MNTENLNNEVGGESEPIQILEVGLENLKEFKDLYLKLLKSDPEAFADDYDEISARTEEAWTESFSRKGKTFVAAANGMFVGMGRINLYDELPGVPVLNKLGVLPEYRGRGIARKIIEAREEWARGEGFKKVRLYVFADRKKTVEFSEKNGYKVAEIQEGGFKRKYGATVDVLIMEKDL